MLKKRSPGHALCNWSVFAKTEKSSDQPAINGETISTDIVATPSSIFCLDALDQLKRFLVTSSKVFVSTHVAKEVQYLIKHHVKMFRTTASFLLDAWSMKLYARNPAIDGKTRPTKSRSGLRTGTLIVKIHRRVIGRVKKPSEEPVRCNDGLHSKVRHILVESLCRVAREVKENLMEEVSLRDPIYVAIDVESIMFENIGPFNGTKQLMYKSLLFNVKDP
ncbi:hypothetical protein SADUNF_Sadunf16G0029200 [Salix dunnii]|uniref:TFIIS central domain-containing protein n=1 Tax=Salix dunnii TaxID=1413687 RepID=A0A835J9J0_9ROSI|nr:hypothetical protein SADUNF_Sadunf16G0029200 [Salix dunnii]